MIDFWKGVYELVKENVIIRGVVALVLVGIMGYMYLTGLKVPPELINVVSMVLGFYFGGITQSQIEKGIKNGKASNSTNSN